MLKNENSKITLGYLYGLIPIFGLIGTLYLLSTEQKQNRNIILNLLQSMLLQSINLIVWIICYIIFILFFFISLGSIFPLSNLNLNNPPVSFWLSIFDIITLATIQILFGILFVTLGLLTFLGKGFIFPIVTKISNKIFG